MKQRSIAHDTSKNTPQNAVIFASIKTATPICRFLGLKKIKHHRTKGKLQFKTFANKINARNSARIHEMVFKLGMQTEVNLARGAAERKISKSKFLF